MFLAKSLSQAARKLGITEVVFSDNDPEKLSVYGTLAKKTAALNDPDLAFTVTTDNDSALYNADYVITTIRPGGDDKRAEEEKLTIAEGVIAQETVGGAGLSFAMRTFPALSAIAESAKRLSRPGVKIFNFTNPVGIVTQALYDAGIDFAYGICDAPTGMLDSFEKLLRLPEGALKGEVYGLNHLSFFKSVTLDGADVTKRIISDPDAYVKTELSYFDRAELERRGYIPNEYLYYYYYPEQALRHMLSAKELRGAQIARINKKLLAELKKIDPENDYDGALKVFSAGYGERESSYMATETGVVRQKPWRFDPKSPEKGGYAGVALKYIEIIESGIPGDMILSCPSGGNIPGLKPTDVAEISVTVTPDGVIPHKFENIPSECRDLIVTMKAYENAASMALRSRKKSDLVSALAANPLSAAKAETLADKYINVNKDFIVFSD